jgi:hypothetical protein
MIFECYLLFNSNYLIMRYIIFLILLLFSLPNSSCKFISTNILSNETELKKNLFKQKQDSIRIADSLKIIQEEQISLENSKLDSVRKEDENRRILNGRLKYKIIVGSFTNSQNARDLLESYKSRGFNSDIIISEADSIEYVSAEAFDDERKAMERLKEFKATIDSKAWLYVAK